MTANPKWIRVQYPQKCSCGCGRTIQKGQLAWWYPATRTLVTGDCKVEFECKLAEYTHHSYEEAK